MIVTNEMLEDYVIFPHFLRAFKISMTAKLIYSVIFTEAMRQNLVDEQGRLFVEIPCGELAEFIHVPKSSVYIHLRTLSDVGLIERKPKTNRIYPKKPVIGEKKSI